MKLKVFIFITAALFLFQSSSPWEGAGTVAPDGVLPSSGRFIATNSFPRNTVVDITNIENNRSIRVIVADSLDSPGLLALVSREAAELIGMRAGSISRIRMIQPSDPIAYLRFMEGAAAGVPGIDPDKLITEENLLEELYANDTYKPPVAAPVVPAPVPLEVNPPYVVEREWDGHGRPEIVDVQGYNVDPYLYEDPGYVTQITEQTKRVEEPKLEVEPVKEPEPVPVEEAKEPVYIVKEEEPVTPYKPAEEIKDTSEKHEVLSEVVKDVTPFYPERTIDDIAKDVSMYAEETSRDEVIKDVSVYVTEADRREVFKDIPEWGQPVETTQQPEPITPEPVEVVQQPEPVEQEPEAVPPKPVSDPAPLQVTEAEPNPPPSNVYELNFNEIFPAVTEAPPVAPVIPVQPPVYNNTPFSVDTITQLDRGWYYVQVAALPQHSVETAIRQIDRNYKPIVYVERDNLYRILIGPLNQGESAAILARFKSIGYKDAFVRRGS